MCTRQLACGLLTYCLILQVASPAQEQVFRDGKETARSSAQDLLSESYPIGRDLVPGERVVLLSYLTETAAKLRTSQVKDWAKEQFQLAFQLAYSWNRVAAEKNALVSLAAVDPDQAIQLFRSMDLPIASSKGTFPEDVRSDGAYSIFDAYFAAHGIGTLTRLRSLATYLGETGQYPYRAMGQLMKRINDPQERVKVASVRRRDLTNSVLSDAMHYYGRGSRFESEDDDYLFFIQQLRTVLSPFMQRKTFQLAVEHLTKEAEPDKDRQFIANVYTSKSVTSFRSRKQVLLSELLPTIRQIDSAWADSIVREHQSIFHDQSPPSEIQRTEGAVFIGDQSGITPALQEQALERGRLQYIDQIAPTKTDEAFRLSQSLSDPSLRSIALAHVATAYQAQSSEHVPTTMQQLRDTMAKVNDGEGRVAALSAFAEASANIGDLPSARTAIEEAFTVGEEVFQQEADTNPGQPAYTSSVMRDLSGLVKVTMKLDARETVNRIHQLRNTVLKAYLLNDAADALIEASKPPKSLLNQAAR